MTPTTNVRAHRRTTAKGRPVNVRAHNRRVEGAIGIHRSRLLAEKRPLAAKENLTEEELKRLHSINCLLYGLPEGTFPLTKEQQARIKQMAEQSLAIASEQEAIQKTKDIQAARDRMLLRDIKRRKGEEGKRGAAKSAWEVVV